MDCKNVETRIMLESLGHDTPLIWQDEKSKIIFEASQFEVLQALFGMNEIIALGGLVTLEDFIMSINERPLIFPDNFDKNLLGRGWNPDCFSCRDGAWVDIIYDAKYVNDKVIFVFKFTVPYCDECSDCEGCDAPAYYDWLHSNSQNPHFL